MTKPIFLFSLPRAGSTLLQRLLLTSGRCAALGEPSLLLRFLGEGPVITRKATYWESLVEAAAADMRGAWSGYDPAYREGVRFLAQGVYDGLAGGKEWFVDKTPRYSLIAREIIETFPDARFLVLWRHPLAVAASLASTYRKGRWCLDEFGIDLHEGQRRLQEACELHGDRICQIRYEDLVSEPGMVMRRIGAYLGWDGLENVLKQDLVTSAGGSLGDPTGLKRYSRLSMESRDAWKVSINNWYRRRWARRYMTGERAMGMKALGYELPDDLKGLGLLGGLSDLMSACRRRRRHLRHPTWLPRFARRFRKEQGYEICFR